MTKKNYRPRVTNRSWFYSVMKVWFYPFAWLFYRRRTYNGKENLLPDKPLFLIPNHQNAFMDATGFIPVKYFWQFAFLMRATSFNNKLAARFLYGLNMLPIYRQLDGADLNESNNEVFQNCAWLMERKRPIICYAEGTHSFIRRIRPIKKGPLRFAFATEERNNWTLDVHFVPVGINYSDRENFGGDYLANIGKPIRLAHYRERYLENPARALNELKKDIEQALEKLAIHIRTQEYYQETEWLREMAINDYRAEHTFQTNQVQEFEKGTETIARAEKIFAQADKAPVLKEKLARYHSLIQEQHLRDTVFAPAYKAVPPVLQWIFFLLFLPFFVAGALINVGPLLGAVAVTNKVVKDPAFRSSILWVTGTVFICLFYVIMLLTIGLITGHWWYALASWPVGIVLGAVALWYKRKWNKFSAENRFRKYAKTTPGKEAINLRQEIMKTLYAA